MVTNKERNESLRAIIFDMDGVLIDTIERQYLSWKRIAEEYNLPFTRKDNEKLLGLTREESLEVILGSKQMDEGLKQKIFERKNYYYHEYIQTMTKSDLAPGIADVLKEAFGEGILLGVASGSRNVKIILEKMSIAGYMEAVVDGNSVRRSKPHPESFLKAAQKMGVAPGTCLVLEDSQAGVLSGLRAGMCVVGVGPPERLSQAQAVFPDTAKINLVKLKKIFADWRKANRENKSRNERKGHYAR
jgi:beta-phosphoglucomutase